MRRQEGMPHEAEGRDQVMLLLARGCQDCQETTRSQGRGREQNLPGLTNPADTLISDFPPPELGDD